jgi:hypothetical protein
VRLAFEVAVSIRDGQSSFVERERSLPITTSERHRSRRVEEPRLEVLEPRPLCGGEGLRQDPLALFVPILVPQDVRERGERAGLQPPATGPRRPSDRDRALVVVMRIREPSQLFACLPAAQRRLRDQQVGGISRRGARRLQRPVVPADRPLGREHAPMAVSREQRVPRRLRGITGSLEVVREDLGELFLAPAGSFLDPRAHRRVPLGAARPRDPRVRHIPREQVVEDQLPLALER